MKKLSRTHLALVVMLGLLAGCAGGQVAPDSTPTTGQLAETPDTELSEIEPDSVPCNLPLPGSDEWQVVLCEEFNDNQNGWEVETQDNPYARYTSAIDHGKFVVDYTAKGFAGYQKTALTWFTIGEEKDFILSITGLMESDFRDASWGIAFRGSEESFYLFSIMNNGKYKFEIYEDRNWVPLITAKSYNGIKLGEENTVRIEAGGQDFYFSINGVMVNRFNGALLEGNQILLVVSAKEGVSAKFTFDDVVMQK